MREESNQKGGREFTGVCQSPPIIVRFAVERAVCVAGIRAVGAIDVGVALCCVRRCDPRPERVDEVIWLANWVEAFPRYLKKALEKTEAASQVHECRWREVFD